MHTTLDHNDAAGFEPEPVSSRVFVRCYRHYGDAKRARDQLSVVGRIPDGRMSVVARGLEWEEALPTGRLYKLACGITAAVGAMIGLLLWAIGLTAAETDWLTATLIAAASAAALGFLGATVLARLRNSDHALAEKTGHMEPRQYDILVEEEHAPAAHAVLAADD